MQKPDDEAKQILATVKDQFHEKAGTSGEGLNHRKQSDLELKTFSVKLLGYKTQVVGGGFNYFMKIAVGDKVIHASVFEPHTGEPAQVESVEDKNHTPESELASFQSSS